MLQSGQSLDETAWAQDPIRSARLLYLSALSDLSEQPRGERLASQRLRLRSNTRRAITRAARFLRVHISLSVVIQYIRRPLRLIVIVLEPLTSPILSHLGSEAVFLFSMEHCNHRAEWLFLPGVSIVSRQGRGTRRHRGPRCRADIAALCCAGGPTPRRGGPAPLRRVRSSALHRAHSFLAGRAILLCTSGQKNRRRRYGPIRPAL